VQTLVVYIIGFDVSAYIICRLKFALKVKSCKGSWASSPDMQITGTQNCSIISHGKLWSNLCMVDITESASSHAVQCFPVLVLDLLSNVSKTTNWLVFSSLYWICLVDFVVTSPLDGQKSLHVCWHTLFCAKLNLELQQFLWMLWKSGIGSTRLTARQGLARWSLNCSSSKCMPDGIQYNAARWDRLRVSGERVRATLLFAD
jgi:hypothetical protein